jgi:FHS family Na+ dependent glucose MFS transporter 1
MALLVLPVAAWLLRLPSPEARVSLGRNHERIATWGVVGLFAVFFFLYIGVEISYPGWLVTYAVEQDLSNEIEAAYLTSGFWAALTLGRLMAVPIARRVQLRYVLRAGLVGAYVSMSIILLWPMSLSAVWIGTLGLGLSIASMFPTMLALAERRMAVTGRVTRWFFIGVGLGGMSLPWLIGQRFEAQGPTAAMAAILLLLIAMGVVHLVLSLNWPHSGTERA